MQHFTFNNFVGELLKKKKPTDLVWTGLRAVMELPSSKTGLSIEYVATGGGDLDFFMLVNRLIRETPFSFFSFYKKYDENNLIIK